MDELQLTVEVNGEKRTYSPEMTYREIAEEYQKDYPAKIILAKVDGRLRELSSIRYKGQKIFCPQLMLTNSLRSSSRTSANIRKSADLLRKIATFSCLAGLNKSLSHAHERLFDLLTLASS